MTLTVEQIKSLSTKDRVREAFKELRRQNIGARMGIPWNQRSQYSRTTDKYIYYEDYVRYYFNADGSLSSHIYCTFSDPEKEIEPVLRSFGIDVELGTAKAGGGYIKGSQDTDIKPLLPKKEQYAVTYTID